MLFDVTTDDALAPTLKKGVQHHDLLRGGTP